MKPSKAMKHILTSYSRDELRKLTDIHSAEFRKALAAWYDKQVTMFISQLFLRSPEEAALMQLAHHRYQSADTFKEAPSAGKEISLRWECPSCGAGGKEDEDRATARFTAPLAQWYSWSFDADGDRKTRHGIVAINPPQPGLLVQCEQCQAEFKIKRT